MKTVPYMYFNGNAADALKFYEKVFQTRQPEVMLFKEMPGQIRTTRMLKRSCTHKLK